MNGAESLVHTLLACGVDTCFANPGTSEMHFVAALDRVPGMRCVLGLFEGVVTGAADGYARMTGKPAATLLHCGPGLANGLANLHNASRARSPIVNIVGDQATYHRPLDAPLTADTEGLARPVSGRVRTATGRRRGRRGRRRRGAGGADPPGQIATLILPSDTCLERGRRGRRRRCRCRPAARRAQRRRSETPASCAAAEPALLLLGGTALRAEALATGAPHRRRDRRRGCWPRLERPLERGRGRVPIDRVPYPVDAR